MATKSPIKKDILNQAVAVAMSSTSKKKVGSIILKKGRLVASAVNIEKKSHPIQAFYGERASNIHNNDGLSQKIYLHSEVNCLIRSKGKGDTIIVARVGGNGGKELRNSKPCPICSLALKEYGIKHVHYSTDYGFFYEYWG
jgi:deoxycytidylate deaminase